MPPFVRGHRTGNASLGSIASQHLTYTAIRVLVLAHGLKQIDRSLGMCLLYMQREQFAEREGKRNLTVLVPLSLCNADLAAFDIHLIEANSHQLAHSNPGIEECFDQNH